MHHYFRPLLVQFKKNVAIGRKKECLYKILFEDAETLNLLVNLFFSSYFREEQVLSILPFCEMS